MVRLPDPLSAVTLAYLAAPACVFALGWLELPAGLAITGLVAHTLYRLNQQLPPRPFARKFPAGLYLIVLATVWAAFSGAGHFFFANTDWRTRDTVYADLILSSWPPSYGMSDGAQLVLRTAMGYFLPPALLAKLTGIEFASVILFAWTALGTALFLLLLPLPQRFGWRLVLLGMMVVLFSGMDWPAIFLIHGHLPIFPLPLEWWRPWTYTSLTGQLFWAPNHALALWLGTALFFRHRSDQALASLGLGLLSLLLLWTPFAVVGLLPWFLLGAIRIYPSIRSALGSTSTVQWLLAVALNTVVVALFSRPGVQQAAALSDMAISKAIELDMEQISGYIQFAAFEFGLLVLLLRPRTVEAKQALALASVILLLLPFIRLGPSNDWLLRVSTPSLLMLLMLTLAEFTAPLRVVRHSARLMLLIVVLTLGALTPCFEFSRALLWKRTLPNYGQTLVAAQDGWLPPHYIGRLDLPVLKALFRTPSPVPEATRRKALLSPSMRHPP